MQHEAHPGLPDYGEVSSRERALEQYAQDLHRREIQLIQHRHLAGTEEDLGQTALV